MPVLFAWAKQDRVIPWSLNREAALTVPHHTIAFFRAGHAAFLEQPRKFAKVFRKFASTLP